MNKAAATRLSAPRPPQGPDGTVLDLPTMQARAEEAAEFLRSMASPHRLMILCHLVEGELPVGALAERVGIGQTGTSQHLARLRAEGLVATRRDGTTIFYRIADLRAAALLQVMYGLFCGAAADICATPSNGDKT